jgi:N-acetylneuraminate synthase
LVEGIRFIEAARGAPIDKDEQAAELVSLRRTFGKSIVAARDLPSGTVLKREDLAVKKPGTGIPARRFHEMVGRRLIGDMQADDLLSEDLLEPTTRRSAGA